MFQLSYRTILYPSDNCFRGAYASKHRQRTEPANFVRLPTIVKTCSVISSDKTLMYFVNFTDSHSQSLFINPLLTLWAQS